MRLTAQLADNIAEVGLVLPRHDDRDQHGLDCVAWVGVAAVRMAPRKARCSLAGS